MFYFYHKQTEEEDMRTTRNQGYIAILQRNKENKKHLIYKTWTTFLSGKNKQSLQIHIVFIYASKHIFYLWNVARHSRQKPQCENLETNCEKSSIERFWKRQLFIQIGIQYSIVHISLIETETPGKLKPTWGMHS